MSTQREKDPIFGTKSVAAVPSKTRTLTDGTRLSLGITQEVAKELYEALGGMLDNERGVKLDIHYGTKVTETTSFLSSFFFVKPILAYGANPNTGAAPGGKFQPKGAQTSAAAAAEMKKLG
jgi:hypothetical protein